MSRSLTVLSLLLVLEPMMGISLGSRNSTLSIQTRLSLTAGGQDFPSFCEHNPKGFSLEIKEKYNQKKFHFCSIFGLAH